MAKVSVEGSCTEASATKPKDLRHLDNALLGVPQTPERGG